MKEQPECTVGKQGNKEWLLHGKLHREDGPAVEHLSGTKEWYLHGYRHREDGPAIVRLAGGKYWYLHGKYHREDGPAIERPNGTKEWWLHGKKAHPETLVDLWLSRGTFCYYDEQTQTLHFAEIK